MLSVARSGLSMSAAGLDEDMRLQLLEAVGMAVADRISSFGGVDEMEEQPGGGIVMRLYLDGVDDEASLAVERVSIAEDGSELALARISSSIPLAAKLIKGLFAEPWRPDDQTRTKLCQIALAIV